MPSRGRRRTTTLRRKLRGEARTSSRGERPWLERPRRAVCRDSRNTLPRKPLSARFRSVTRFLPAGTSHHWGSIATGTCSCESYR